ncbi:unnamed protein product [Moneuplotes crassus]|uniref:BZIP domain-containing protein n=1 Tax=Euplotes crassus TaxID=5936 RepID=A0AAD1XNZ0_EUPCR|nr:unnamed protein product [Moneuplotes crassus]
MKSSDRRGGLKGSDASEGKEGERKVKSNNLRAKEYRDRKKQYLTKLEETNKKLVQENMALKKEIWELKKEISSMKPTKLYQNESKAKIDHHENFAFVKLPKMFKENPDSVRFSQIEMALSDLSEWGPDRVNVVKKAFDDILTYMVSKDNKCFHAVYKKMNMSEYLNKLGRKRVIKNKYKELEEPGPEEIALDLNLSDDLMNYLKKNGHGFMQTTRTYKKLVKQLITIRNAIITAGQEKQKYHDQTKIYESHSKLDFIKVSDLVKKLDGSKFVSPHSLWDLPVRDPDSDIYKGCELSE